MALEKSNKLLSGSFIRGIIIVVLLVLAFFVLKPFKIVDAGYRGLKFTMGKLHNEVLNEGPRFRWPLVQKIEEVSIRPIQLDHDVTVGPDGAITKDNQNVGASMTLFYKYIPEKLADMWRDVGEEKFSDIAEKAMRTYFKQSVGKHTIFDIAPIQEEIRIKVLTDLRADLCSKFPIELIDLNIVNYDWPDSFEKSIEETMQKAQLVKQKQQDLLVAQQEAQKQVKQAEAVKTAAITAAEGRKVAAALDAEAQVLKGEGIRKYNAAIAANMDLEIKFRELDIKKIEASRWNGQNVPNNVYSPIPISTGGIQGVVQPSK